MLKVSKSKLSYNSQKNMVISLMRFIVIILLSLITLTQTYMMYADNESNGSNMDNNIEKAVFAGGCFWCIQNPYDDLMGVVTTAVGYTGGNKDNPTYEEVCAGNTGHAEAIEILYDPSQISYAELLNVFWRNIDPTTLNRQFADVGTQYRTAIFYDSEEQRQSADHQRKRWRGQAFMMTQSLPKLPGLYVLQSRRVSSKILREIPPEV